MAVVGELEALIHNHNLLISRGEITEGAKIKAVISGYLSSREMVNRFYKTISGSFEEFIFCAESNFDKFQEIINYKHLTQMEYYYPEYFQELTRRLNDSAKKRLSAANHFYAGLLCASSLTADRKIMLEAIGHFLEKRMFPQIERIFDRLEETRQMVKTFNAQAGKEVEVLLISDPEAAEKIGHALFDAYSSEMNLLESQEDVFVHTRNAYVLARILSNRMPELGLITDGSLISSAILYFKELVLRVDIDSIDELIHFVRQFMNIPATKRFSTENPELFHSYLNSPDVRQALNELVRNLLGKTRFEEVYKLSEVLKGMFSFVSICHDHLSSLKETKNYIEAIEMAEKLQMKEEITEDLKIEAFRKLISDCVDQGTGASINRLKNFSIKQNINTDTTAGLAEEISGPLEEVEKHKPELRPSIEQLCRILRLERVKKQPGLSAGKLFEPIFAVFAWIFKVFVSLVMLLAGRTSSAKPGS